MKSFTEIVPELPRYQGDICREINLPSHETLEGCAFRIPCRGDGIELVAALLTDLVLKRGQEILIECSGARSRTGPYREFPLRRLISGPKTFLPGEELARFSSFPPEIPWWKWKISANADLSSAAVTIYLVRKG